MYIFFTYEAKLNPNNIYKDEIIYQCNTMLIKEKEYSLNRIQFTGY